MKGRSVAPGSTGRALLEMDDLLSGLERHAEMQGFYELILFLDGEESGELGRIIDSLFHGKRKARSSRMILAMRLQDALTRQQIDPAAAVDILYRVLLGVFPDRAGSQFYSRQLETRDLTAFDLQHILVGSRPLAFAGDCLRSPSLVTDLWPMISIRLQRRLFRRTSPTRQHRSHVDQQGVSIPHTTGESLRPVTEDTEGRPLIAVVVHRAGEGFSGGAEKHAMVFARYLTEIASTEILTTCARDYLTWRNEFPAGSRYEHGLRIRRFPVIRERNPRRFARLSALVRWLQDVPGIPRSLVRPFARLWMREQGPLSPALLEYLRQNRNAYDVFVFFTYLYDTTFSGLPLVADRAVLVPTAHPEWPLRLPIWKGFFACVKRMVFNSEEERQLLRQWFPGIADGPVLGCGIDPPNHPAQRRSFRDYSGITGPFLLYTGRIDPEKGCRRLIGLFLRYLRESGRDLTLVLLGTQEMALPRHDRIFAPGFVDQDILESALRECSVYVHPSAYESLSFSLLEALQLGRPVLVTAESDVLRGHVLRSHGGLSYRDADEFFSRLDILLKSPKRFAGGPAYVRKRYSHAAVRGPFNRWILSELQALHDSPRSLRDQKNASSLSR